MLSCCRGALGQNFSDKDLLDADEESGEENRTGQEAELEQLEAGREVKQMPKMGIDRDDQVLIATQAQLDDEIEVFSE